MLWCSEDLPTCELFIEEKYKQIKDAGPTGIGLEVCFLKKKMKKDVVDVSSFHLTILKKKTVFPSKIFQWAFCLISNTKAWNCFSLSLISSQQNYTTKDNKNSQYKLYAVCYLTIWPFKTVMKRHLTWFLVRGRNSPTLLCWFQESYRN